ncbi:hypothetical protein [Actinophytocola sediminis]
MTRWQDDEGLLADLGAAVRARSAVPHRLVEIGKAAFAWRTVDGELAGLIYDSASCTPLAGSRAGSADRRALTFVTTELTIELEVAPDALSGQLVPPQRGTVEMHSRDGETSSAEADDVGWFVVRPRPSGLCCLRVSTPDGRQVRTEWTRF